MVIFSIFISYTYVVPYLSCYVDNIWQFHHLNNMIMSSSTIANDKEASSVRNAHASPPARLKKIYKQYQLMKDDMLAVDPNVADFSISNGQERNRFWRVSCLSTPHIQTICDAFDILDNSVEDWDGPSPDPSASYIVYESVILPGQLQY